MLGTQTWGDRMQGSNESIELWWHSAWTFFSHTNFFSFKKRSQEV